MFIIIFILLILVSGTAKSQSLNTLSARFERKLVKKENKELVKGTIYYQAQKEIVVETDTPVEQLMTISDKVMLIYYPNKKKAFRIKSKREIIPPFIQLILRAMKEDYGLGELGYTFIKHQMKDDTLYAYWEPPSEKREVLGEFILGMLSDKVVYAELQNPDGIPAVKSFFRKHLKFGDSYIPSEIHSEYYNDKSKIIKREHIIFSKVKFNPVLPDRILNFELPDEVSVKELEW